MRTLPGLRGSFPCPSPLLFLLTALQLPPVTADEAIVDSPVVLMGRFEGLVPVDGNKNGRNVSRTHSTHNSHFLVRKASARASERPNCARFERRNWRCVAELHSDSIHLFEGGDNMAQLIIQEASGGGHATVLANTYYDHGPSGITREYGTFTFGSGNKTSKLFYRGHGSALVVGHSASGLSFGGRIHKTTGIFAGMIGEVAYVQRYMPFIDEAGNIPVFTYYAAILDYEGRRKEAPVGLLQRNAEVQAALLENELSGWKQKQERANRLFHRFAPPEKTPNVLMAIVKGRCGDPNPKDGSLACDLVIHPENLTTTIGGKDSDPVQFSFVKDETSAPIATWHSRLHQTKEMMYGLPLWEEKGTIDFGGNTTLSYSGILPGATTRTMHGKALSTTGLLSGREAVIAACFTADISEGLVGHVVLAFL